MVVVVVVMTVMVVVAAVLLVVANSNISKSYNISEMRENLTIMVAMTFKISKLKRLKKNIS